MHKLIQSNGVKFKTNTTWVAGAKQGLLIAAGALALVIPPQFISASMWSPLNHQSFNHLVHRADFGREIASEEAQFIANWVADSADNEQLSFVIIDKKHAQVFVFDKAAKILGSTPVLLGAAKGDDSVPGIGQRPISKVLPEERTTPAGRFMGEPGRNASGEDVVWVDYDAAVSMHRVRVVDPKERRLERLATPSIEDNRISYGCINVPVAFFDGVLKPQFKAKYGVIYVLPDTKPMREVFANAYGLPATDGVMSSSLHSAPLPLPPPQEPQPVIRSPDISKNISI